MLVPKAPSLLFCSLVFVLSVQHWVVFGLAIVKRELPFMSYCAKFLTSSPCKILLLKQRIGVR